MINTTIKVAAVISDEGGRLLMIKEKYNAEERYKWNFVKGTFDNAKESLIECAQREIREEVNLNIKNISLFKILQYGDEENFRILFVFDAKIDSLHKKQISIKNQQLDENIIEYKWFEIEELKRKKNDFFIAPYVKKVINSLQKDLKDVTIEKI